MRTCDVVGCDRKHVAKGYCSGHYNRANYSPQQRHPKVQVPCTACGAIVEKYQQNRYRPVCSDECRYVVMHGYRKEDKPAPIPRPKAVKADQRSPLRRAYEDGDHATVLSEVLRKTTRTSDGCMEWQGRVKDGYPTLVIGRSYLQAHRVALESSMGQKLGSQHAHHKCANTRCINPEHLQPITHRENIAEMMARQAYLARIRELEEALRAINPAHHLLTLVAVA